MNMTEQISVEQETKFSGHMSRTGMVRSYGRTMFSF